MSRNNISSIMLVALLTALCISLSSAQVDSTQVVARDKTPSKRVTFFDLFEGKPGRAALYSFLLPGAGQLYNKKYWKVPLAVAIDGFTIYNVITSRSNYLSADAAYKAAIANPGTGNTAQLRDIRDSRRKRYEYSWVYLVIGHMVGAIDAYVDRHMMTFDISEDLTLHVTPKTMKTSLFLTLGNSKVKKKPIHILGH